MLRCVCVCVPDYTTGFGGRYGVQTDRVDQSAVGFDYQGKTEKHESQKGLFPMILCLMPLLMVNYLHGFFPPSVAVWFCVMYMVDLCSSFKYLVISRDCRDLLISCDMENSQWEEEHFICVF